MVQAHPGLTITNKEPVVNATAVMNSAIRVTGDLQPAWETRKMAEMSVPAWLIPMKNTNMVMYKPVASTHKLRLPVGRNVTWDAVDPPQQPFLRRQLVRGGEPAQPGGSTKTDPPR